MPTSNGTRTVTGNRINFFSRVLSLVSKKIKRINDLVDTTTVKFEQRTFNIGALLFVLPRILNPHHT